MNKVGITVLRGAAATVVALVCAAALCCGCSPSSSGSAGQGTPVVWSPLVSPLVGKWSGEAKLSTGSDLVKITNAISGDRMTGQSSLSLNDVGTGYLKVAKSPEQPITWKQDGDKVTIETKGASDSDKGSEGSKKTGTLVGTVSDDKKRMSIDLGQVVVKLSKEGSSQTP